MKMKIIGVLAILVIILGAIVFCVLYSQDHQIENNVSNNDNNQTSVASTSSSIEPIEASYSDSDFNYSMETLISLADNSTKVDGTNVKIDGNTIYIVGAGSYRITGSLSNGQIIVNAPKENVKIILDNVSIKCETSSPLYIYKSKTTMIYLEENSNNYLEDGSTYVYVGEYMSEEDEDPDATLYSKSDLVLKGNGSLSVKANYNNAITSKDTFIIEDANIKVDSKNHGINGKDILTIKNANIEVVSLGDGIRSSSGNVEISSGNFKIDAGDDGIHAENTLIIDDGTFIISDSYEGLEGVNIIINGGDIDITSQDDGINVNGGNDGSAFAKKGRQNMENMGRPNDMNFENNNEFRKQGNRNNPPENLGEKPNDGANPPENLEEKPNGGNVPLNLNNSNQSDTEVSYKLVINGGNIKVNAQGDGLDSNGAIEMNGGYVVVQGPTSDGNGALDYNNYFTLNKGTLIAIGAAGMSQGVKTGENQGAILVTLDTNQTANTKIEIKDSNGNVIFEISSAKSFRNIVFTSSDIKVDEQYSIFLNGELVKEVIASSNTSSSGMGGFRGRR